MTYQFFNITKGEAASNLKYAIVSFTNNVLALDCGMKNGWIVGRGTDGLWDEERMV